MTLEELKEYAHTQHGLIAAQQRLGTTYALDNVIEKAHAAGEALGREKGIKTALEVVIKGEGWEDSGDYYRAILGEAARNTP